MTIDWQTARDRRDDGMARAEAHAGPDWNALADDYIRGYARVHEFFHVDEFWAWALPRGLTPRKAIGPAIKRAAAAGILVRTHYSAPSVRSNLSDKPVWRCATYRGELTGTFRDFAVAS